MVCRPSAVQDCNSQHANPVKKNNILPFLWSWISNRIVIPSFYSQLENGHESGHNTGTGCPRLFWMFFGHGSLFEKMKPTPSASQCDSCATWFSRCSWHSRSARFRRPRGPDCWVHHCKTAPDTWTVMQREVDWLLTRRSAVLGDGWEWRSKWCVYNFILVEKLAWRIKVTNDVSYNFILVTVQRSWSSL